MRLTVNRLVVIVLFLVALFFILTIGGFFGKAVLGGVDTQCMTSVGARIAALSMGGDVAKAMKSDLKGCDTYKRDVDEMSDAKIRKQFAEDYKWCYYSYHLYGNASLLTKDDTFCRVCAVYNGSHQPVGGIFKEIEKQTGGAISFKAQDGSKSLEGSSVAFPSAIVFVQSRQEPKTLLNSMFGSAQNNMASFVPTGVGGALVIGLGASASLPAVVLAGGVAGLGMAFTAIWVSKAVQKDAEVSSNIFIIPKRDDMLHALGCKTVTPT